MKDSDDKDPLNEITPGSTNQDPSSESPEKKQDMPQAKEQAKEPVAEEPVTEVPEEKPAEEPVAEEPVAEEPVAEEPVAKEPVAEEPVAETTEKSKDTPGPGTKPSLMDDSEEKELNNFYDDLENGDHNKEPSSGKEEPEEEKINYALLSREDLVKVLKEKLDQPDQGKLRTEVDEIRKVFQNKQDSLLTEKKERFLGEGGEEADFKPAEDPVDTEMMELLDRYRVLKAEYARDQEKSKQENLATKEEVLVKMKALMEGQEGFESTFRKFKELQRTWFATGQIPQARLKDLWSSYNFHVDQFNDYVRINRELRALDLKKNLELKIQLCERTEELDKESNVVSAFKTLQKYHTRWREIGPVPRSDRDAIWDRFKQATSLINRKHQDYHARMKESLHDNLLKKIALCEKVEAIASGEYESHSAWSEKTQEILDIQKTWKTIGYAPKKDNNVIYARFRKACDSFFAGKAGFYSSAREEQQKNLVKKREIVEKAEELSGSQDWKTTTSELINLQKQWKDIGPVSRRDSDRLWRRFRAACDQFFNNKNSYYKNIDANYEENMKAKENVLAEMETYAPVEEQEENLKALEDFQRRYDAIGYVPSKQKEQIRERFHQMQDKLLENCGMSDSERSMYRFRNRIKGISQGSRPDVKLGFERDKLVNRLQQLRSDIAVWENNIGFFKTSDPSDDTIKGFHEKIEAAHERIKQMELKIRIIDDAENAN